MKKFLSLAAVAATSLSFAFASPAIATSPAAVTAPSAQSATLEYDHIRTTLHGTRGPVVVLIPGMSTPGAVWDDSVAALVDDHRLLVVEVRGFEGARVPANERPGLIDAIIADLSADLARRRFAHATIVGHSFGGLLAMKFGLVHADQTDRILIVDALPFFGTVFDGAATVESMTPRANQMRDMLIAQADAIRAAGAQGTTSGAAGASMVIDPAVRVKVANWSLKAEPTVVAQALYEDILTDLRLDIAQLAMPVTVLYQAAQNPAAAKLRYETDYAALPAARLIPVDKTSHFIMLDRPDAFHAALAELLATPVD